VVDGFLVLPAGIAPSYRLKQVEALGKSAGATPRTRGRKGKHGDSERASTADRYDTNKYK